MNDMLTPPAAPAAPAAPTPPPPSGTSPGGAGRVVSILAIVLGALILLGTVTGAVVGTVRDALRQSGTWTADASGVRSLDVEAAASLVTIEFGDVDEAVLEVTDARRGDWRLERDGDRLVLRSPDRMFGWGPDWTWGGWGDDGETAVLTLPESLRDSGLDADLALSAGELRADGEFGRLALELGGGAMHVTGSAETLHADVSAGQTQIDLEGVTEATFTVSAGRLFGDLTGDAPDAVAIDVSAGSLELELPDDEYDVRSDVSAGSFDNGLDVAASAPHEVTVEVSAGRVQLTEGD
ncbi:hypothetical protein GCM10027426_25690 [Microbacterium lacusdiani]